MSTLEPNDWFCGHFVGNNQSRRIIEKNGFVFFAETEFETRYDTREISRNHVLYNPQKER